MPTIETAMGGATSTEELRAQPAALVTKASA
jgi:hypothetical protein